MSNYTHSISSNECCSIKDKPQLEYIQQLQEQLPKILKNPVIQSFIRGQEDKNLINETFENPTLKNIKLLNNHFKNFYFINRVERYGTILIRNLSAHLSKEGRERDKRYNLIFDKPYDNEGNTVGTMLQEDNQPYIDPIEIIEAGIFPIKNEKLDNAMRSLKVKQKQIMYYYFVQGLKKREIANLLGESEQSISYWVKKTLNELRNAIE